MSELQHLAPIPGFDGYQVTQDGTVTGPCGFALKPRNGRVGLYRKGKTHRLVVADLVAAAWAQPSEAAPAPEDAPAPQPEPDDDARQAAAATIADQAELIEELREIIAALEADLSTVTRQRDKALRQRDALAVTRLIEVARPTAKPTSRRMRQ